VKSAARMMVSALVVAAVSTALAETAARPEDSAQSAAESWLKLTDAGEGGASWDQAAKRLQGKVTKEQWKQALVQLRAPLGRVVRRQVKSRRYAEKVPGASDAPNVTIEFETVFEKKGRVVETITPMLEPDGVWRVAGYTIR
jgi:hypothetical protein